MVLVCKTREADIGILCHLGAYLGRHLGLSLFTPALLDTICPVSLPQNRLASTCHHLREQALQCEAMAHPCQLAAPHASCYRSHGLMEPYVHRAAGSGRNMELVVALVLCWNNTAHGTKQGS